MVKESYGARSARHERIMSLPEAKLVKEFPWLEDVQFEDDNVKAKDIYPTSGDNKLENYQKGRIQLPETSYILGKRMVDTQKEKKGDAHYFIIGTPGGRVMKKLLQAKWNTIESGTAFGKDLNIEVDDDEKDRMYALVRLMRLEKGD